MLDGGGLHHPRQQQTGEKREQGARDAHAHVLGVECPAAGHVSVRVGHRKMQKHRTCQRHENSQGFVGQFPQTQRVENVGDVLEEQ